MATRQCRNRSNDLTNENDDDDGDEKLVSFYHSDDDGDEKLVSFYHSDVTLIIFDYSTYDIRFPLSSYCWSKWPRDLRRRSAASRLLRLRVRIPPGAWMFVVSVVCCQVEVFATS